MDLHGLVAELPPVEVQSHIAAAVAVAEAVEPTYGPLAADLLLVRGDGSLLQTNDGATVVQELAVMHPAAQVLVDLARAQDAVVGDGTTGAVLLCGSLLRAAAALLADRYPLDSVLDTFGRCAQRAVHHVTSALTLRQPADRPTLLRVATVALSSKVLASQVQLFAQMVVDALQSVQHPDDVHVLAVQSGSLKDSFLVHGIALHRPFVYAGHESLPRHLTEAPLLVLDAELEYRAARTHARVDITPEELRQAVAAEWALLDSVIATIAAAGTRIVLSAQVIGDAATQAFARHGIVALGRIGGAQAWRAARAFGAQVLHGLAGVDATHLRPALGCVQRYDELGAGSQRMHVLRCDSAAEDRPARHTGHTVAIVLHAPGASLLAEAQRALHDALQAVHRVRADGGVVYGGGAMEAALCARLLADRDACGPDASAAVWTACADALLDPVRVLVRNAGQPAGLVPALLRAHRQALVAGGESACACPCGLDLEHGMLADMSSRGVLEPARSRIHALLAATDAAVTVLRLMREHTLRRQLARIAEQPARAALESAAAAEAARQTRLAQRRARQAGQGTTRLRPWLA